MKKLNLFILTAIGLIFGACGTTEIQEDKTYDMWLYMTPPHSIYTEYDFYENGKKIDYFYETVNVFPEKVERLSGNDRTVLTPFGSYIRVEEPNGDVISVQRYLKIGDNNIFDSSTNQNCKAEEFFHSIRIKGNEFYNVIKVACINSDRSTSDIYYGYDEGIVAINKNKNGKNEEIVKVHERRLQ